MKNNPKNQNKSAKGTVEKPKGTVKFSEKPNPDIKAPKYMQVREAEKRSKAQELMDLIDNISKNTKK